MARNDTVFQLYEKLYEDNATGRGDDESLMQLSHKCDVKRPELKSKLSGLRKKLSASGKSQTERADFIYAVRQFMQMNRLTASFLMERIDRIDVFENRVHGQKSPPAN